MLKDSDLPPYKPIPKHKPDRLTYIVRFVCGAVVGAIMGCCASVFAVLNLMRHNAFRDGIVVKRGAFFEHEPLMYAVCGVAILLFGLVCGVGAMIFGDRFWGDMFDR